MEFVELTSEEFSKVCDSFKGNSFYQSISWANIKSNTGWISYYVGVKNKEKIVACSIILGKKLYLNKYLYYAPRGMLLDYNDSDLLKFFVNNLKSFLKKKNGVVFKIDPLVEYQDHDKDGNIIGDKSNKNIVDDLFSLGFKHHGFSVGYTDELQFRWSYGLDITTSMDEIQKNMDQRCRRCIRKYEKYPLKVMDVNDDNIQDFKGIMEHTASRQNHFDRSIDYYKSLDTEFGDRSKLIIIYLDRDKFLNDFKDDKLYEMVKNDNRKMIPVSIYF